MASRGASQKAGRVNLTLNPHGRHYSTGLLLAIVLLGTALRLYQLDADSMWRDEILTANRSRQELSAVLAPQEKHRHPPLVDLVTGFLIRLSGDSDFVVRAQAMLFGSLAILLVYKVGLMLWARTEGLVGALLLAANAFHIEYSQEARSYALMAFLSLLSLIFLLQAMKNDRKYFWAGFILCTTLSLYNHYFAVLFLPAAVAFAGLVIAENWFSGRRRAPGDPDHTHSTARVSPPRLVLNALLSLAVVSLLFVPWLPALRIHLASLAKVPPGASKTATGPEAVLVFLREVLADYSGLGGLSLLVWLAVLVLGLAVSRRSHLALAALWVTIPFVALALLGSGIPMKQRTMIFILPICLLLLARGITALANAIVLRLQPGGTRHAWAKTFAAGIGAAIVVSASAPSIGDYYLSENRDWRGAAQYIESRLGPQDIVLTDGSDYQTGLDGDDTVQYVAYYLSPTALETTDIFPVEAGLVLKLQRSARSGDRIWAVLSPRGVRPKERHELEEVEVEDFHFLYVLSPRQPSGAPLQDTVSILEALLVLLPTPSSRFDVHLALAEIHAEEGRPSEAASQLVMARLTAPDRDKAGRDLADAGVRLASSLGLHLDQVVFGDLLRVPGYRLQPIRLRLGQPMIIELWLEALRPVDKDYTLFVHLVGPAGHIWAQDDRLLEYEGVPTSAWEVGQVVRIQSELKMPGDAPSGEYTVQAGLYHWQTGERLPVWDESGERLPDDAIVLDSMSLAD